MKIVTFKSREINFREETQHRIGNLVSDTEIVDLTTLVSNENLTAGQLLKCYDIESGFIEKARNAGGKSVFPFINRKDIEICAPVPRPGKVICVGLNYRDHAAESGMPIPTSPIIFSKFATCVIGANQPIVLPETSHQVDYEAELAFVIGRTAKNVKKTNALDYVFGYTNFNDVSARDFQFADGQWQRGKSCDTFAPIGEFVATIDEIENPHNLSIKLRLNGEILQDSNTKQLIFNIPEIIEFLSSSMTLEAGDVIATGTPPGVGFARKPPIFMKDGDTVEVEIEGLGVLSNPVKAQ